MCGQLTTPLKYFLYPARVEPASEVWNSADFAVLLDIWDEQDGVVRCGNNAREGTIEQAISPQTAIAKFPTTPDS